MRKEVAYHEAGHALASVNEGLVGVEIKVDPMPRACVSNIMPYETALRKLLVIKLAGGVAVEILNEKEDSAYDLGDSDDLEKIDIINTFVEGYHGRDDTVNNQKEMREVVKQFLLKYWSAVAEIAEKCIEDQGVSNGFVMTIAARHKIP